MATVRVMSPAETPTAEAKAITFRRPDSRGITRVICLTTDMKETEEVMDG